MDSEEKAWKKLRTNMIYDSWDFDGFIEQSKSKGYRAVRLVDVDELRKKVEGLGWGSRRLSDNIDRSAVLALLDTTDKDDTK